MKTYAIDEMAPWMWLFAGLLEMIIFIAVLHHIYVWAAENPCEAYNFISHWWKKVGDHCVT